MATHTQPKPRRIDRIRVEARSPQDEKLGQSLGHLIEDVLQEAGVLGQHAFWKVQVVRQFRCSEHTPRVAVRPRDDNTFFFKVKAGDNGSGLILAINTGHTRAQRTPQEMYRLLTAACAKLHPSPKNKQKSDFDPNREAAELCQDKSMLALVLRAVQATAPHDLSDDEEYAAAIATEIGPNESPERWRAVLSGLATMGLLQEALHQGVLRGFCVTNRGERAILGQEPFDGPATPKTRPDSTPAPALVSVPVASQTTAMIDSADLEALEASLGDLKKLADLSRQRQALQGQIEEIKTLLTMVDDEEKTIKGRLNKDAMRRVTQAIGG